MTAVGVNVSQKKMLLNKKFGACAASGSDCPRMYAFTHRANKYNVSKH